MDHYEMPRSVLVDLLQRRGFLGEGEPTDHEIDVAIRTYQNWHGLKVDGLAGEKTQRSLEARRICALPDINRSGVNLCKWEKREITWAFANNFSLNNITRDQAQEAFQDAFDRWSKVCNIQAEYYDPSVHRTLDVVITSGRIDGPQGTLAWSELPCGADRQLTQKYDSHEPFAIALNPGQSLIGLPHVATHEIGHVIGSDHIRDPGNLMNPTYSSRIYEPQAGDIREAVARYGPPVSSPDEPDEPQPPGVDPECRECMREAISLAREWMKDRNDKEAVREATEFIREVRQLRR